jgi:hypothetical protein|tara:strand:- start:475 stop:1176 length:702 start_codon:yes stop_codon:yes gene_type:complete
MDLRGKQVWRTRMDLKVFLGWDSREDIAYQVARYSILKYNPHIEVVPLKLYELREQGCYWRAGDKKASTEFTISRFLTPFLSGYTGYSLFADCDVLALGDIQEIMKEVDTTDNRKPVWCVQHDYSPSSTMKMDGQMQHIYPRKNWSSVMLFDNELCENLSPDLVNEESPMYLHRMNWAQEVGNLKNKWNSLAGYYKEDPKLIHYTDGGPWFERYRDCPHADKWQDSIREMYGL